MHIYIGTFLIAFTTLALEVTLSRLLSVVAWYHLAFFAVSTAMLGMTAGAVTVYLRPRWFVAKRLATSLSRACLAFAFSIPIALVLLCMIPLELPLAARRVTMGIASLSVATFTCALPFYFSGVVVSGVLTRSSLPVGKLYAVDLIGAAGGCLFVMGALTVLSAPSCILLSAALAGMAGLIYGIRSGRRFVIKALIGVVFLGGGFTANAISPFGIRPVYVKGVLENPMSIHIERWNSFSRVVAFNQFVGPGQLWGGSVNTPPNKTTQRYLTIDGQAGTTMSKFETDADIDYLRYDVTNVVYHLRGDGPAAIIGVGGGRDVQSALLFGRRPVTGIDVNPIFIDLAKDEFLDFSGIGGRDDVQFVVDDARAYLSETEETFTTIQMSLIDTWASTGAGAFSLSENSLYTVEAWAAFIRRLKEDGVFTVSRWYSPRQLAETGRVLSLAVTALFEVGVEDPMAHIVMVTNKAISSLLLSRTPFTESDLRKLRNVCKNMAFQLTITPGEPVKHMVLKTILESKSRNDLEERVADYPLNYSPPTDQNPYFFNMLRLGSIFEVKDLSAQVVIGGNIKATAMLIGLILTLLLITVATIVVPLRFLTPEGETTSRREPVRIPSAIYFSLIGAGFMCIEIALIQRLSVFLGHPVYGLGVLLFTIILSTGIGSAVSERFSFVSRRSVLMLPVIAAGLTLTADLVVSRLVTSLITWSTIYKVLVSVVTLMPLGIVLGFFFPVGMRLSQRLENAQAPWYWALNGIFGVLFSAIAVLISIYAGISKNFYIGVACYLALVPCIRLMLAKKKTTTP